jgi:hypothetical protein
MASGTRVSDTDRRIPEASLRAALKDPTAAQARLLRAILDENARTAYGRTHEFSGIADLKTYRREVPAVSYGDLKSYVDRMMDDEPDVLVPGKPVFFGRTSGTSGTPKHVGYPVTTELEYWSAFAPMLAALERDHPGASVSAMVIGGTYVEGRTSLGVAVGSASGFVRNLPCFEGDPYFHLAPEPVFEIADYEARYYALLRFALAKPLRLLSALNPSTLLTLFAKAEQYADALAHDLAEGTLEAGPVPSREIVPRIPGLLVREPDAAARLRAATGNSARFDPLCAWPDLAVIQTWKGGTSGHYLAALRARCPRCAIRSAMSGSTEGLLLVPLDDAWAGGVPALTSSVLEFLPEDSEPVSNSFVDVSDLEEGQGYRVALTNRRGLYRYLMDDVFFVESRVDRTPVLRFSHRHGLTSSLTGEKLTEPDVGRASSAAEAATGIRPLEYQLVPEWGEPPRYVLLAEFDARPDLAVVARFLLKFEDGLREANLEYAAKRDSQRLAPPEMLVLEKGGFDRLRSQRAKTRGGSDAQTKIPHLAREFLNREALGVSTPVGWASEP